MTNSAYNAHTDSLFKASKILKFQDIYELYIVQHIHAFLTGSLPQSISMIYEPANAVHTYATRNNVSYKLRAPKVRTIVARNSIIVRAPTIWNNIPENVYLKNDNVHQTFVTKSCLTTRLTRTALHGYGGT